MNFQKSIAFLLLFLLVVQCKKALELEPAVETGRAENISAKSAIVHAEIIDIGNGISDYGHCYKELSIPTASDLKTSFGSEKQLKKFKSELTGLEPGTEYKVRAYVKSGDKTYYGSVVSLKTNDGIAVLETGEVTNIRVRSAHCEGFIISSGGEDIIEKGFCWSKNSELNIGSCSGRVSVNHDSASFQGELEGLKPGTSYFVNTYAVTSVDTSYGISKEFTTRDGVLKFDDFVLKDSSSSSLSIEFEILDNGGDSIESLGICWSERVSPEIGDYSVVLGSDTGRYVYSILNLKQNTPYYIRPFGTNSVNTFYGSQLMHNTGVGLSVRTTPVSGIRMSSARTGGQIFGSKDATISERGVCWGLQEEPTVDENKSVSSDGSDIFSADLTGLESNTTYYVKAYVAVGQLVIYGESQSFVTDDGRIDIQTMLPENISYTSALCGGTVLDDGGDSVTARGVCWSNHDNPTLSDNYSADGSGTGAFTSALSGLRCEATYFVRAYATNSAGTGYGDPVEFSTTDCMSVTDYDGNSYQIIKIGNQTWMAENLRTTHYSDGSAIPLVEGVVDWEHLDDNEKAYCFYDNSLSNKYIYGALYTWSAAMDGAGSSDAIPSGVQGVCPSGWHLPSDSEYRVLVNALGDSSIVGGMLKQAGYTHWLSPNLGATNETGYAALPAGYRDIYGEFTDKGLSMNLWTSKDNLEKYAWFRPLYFDGQAFYSFYWHKKNGFSVRCIKNE